MPVLLKSTGRWLRVGWFWPLALLALPMCTLDFDNVGPQSPDPAFNPGPSPVTSAVMCDIPKPVVEELTDCVTDPDEATAFMSLAHAALALNLGETTGTALDFSTAATTACSGMPRKVDFYGPFPEGLTVCLNCASQIPEIYPGPTDVCIAQCKDLINANGIVPNEGVDTFCALNARPSTNFNKDACYEGFCTTGGSPIPTANDPRRTPEDLTWVDLIGNTTAAGSTLSFAGPGSDTVFTTGAASEQLITTGDAWVEFEAGETGVSHAVGVRTSCDDVASCPDTDPTLATLPLALSLNRNDGDNVFIIENGEVLAGPFPAYVPGERFRIQITDHNDSTADIAFFRYSAACVPNMPCSEPAFYTYTGAARPNYPLRVDAIFREANASLQNVTVMRIK